MEAESIAASGAADKDLTALRDELAEHRVTLAGGFAVVYARDTRVMDSIQAPAESTLASLHPGLEEGGQGPTTMLRGQFSANLLAAAQRRDQPVLKIGTQEYALGIAATASGKMAVSEPRFTPQVQTSRS